MRHGEEITKEALEEDMKKVWGLLITEAPESKVKKFALVSALDKNGEIKNIMPNPEVLRIYAKDEKDNVREWTDMCVIETTDMLYGTLLSYARKWHKIKVIFTLDDCETIQHFEVENPVYTQ